MYDEGQKKDYEWYRFQAALHNMDLDAKSNSVETAQNESGSVPSTQSFVFDSPENYANLSAEEREQLTQEMMGKHRHWAANSPLSNQRKRQ